MSTKVIIGAGLGDEGKGMLTDYYSDDKTLVIRFNGGGQAAHTVVTPDGKEHVFHHVGSGTFRGASTYLSEFFIINPLVLMEELTLLQAEYDIVPNIHVHPKSLVSTPYDMDINQGIEEARSIHKHGSCGIGINETIVRSENPKYCIRVEDLLDVKKVEEKMHLIRTEYYEARCKELNIHPKKETLEDDDLVTGMRMLFDLFRSSVDIMDDTNLILTSFDHVIFEGAQGLLLDEDHEWFPHVTRSKTGLDNVLVLADRYDLNDLEVIYVSRCYSTRHGAGPLPHEVMGGPPYPKACDPSNPENKNQGKMRYGYLDLSLLEKTVKADMKKGNGQIKSSKIAITCLDQIHPEKEITFSVDDKDVPFHLQKLSESLFLSIVESRIGIPVIRSYGRTRDDVVE